MWVEAARAAERPPFSSSRPLPPRQHRHAQIQALQPGGQDLAAELAHVLRRLEGSRVGPLRELQVADNPGIWPTGPAL